MIAYKLFRTLKSRPGELFPLFIDKGEAVPIGKWVKAKCVPTKGFAVRPGWHSGEKPYAPHLLKKDGTLSTDRVWAEVEVPIKGTRRVRIPALKDQTWIVSNRIRVKRILTPKEVEEINIDTTLQ